MEKIGTQKSISKRIKDNQFYTKKKFGQNFLVDQNILQKIVNIPSITSETLVIEIGPGLGSLTEHLLEKAKHVLAYEIDTDLIEILTKEFTQDSFSLIEGDFLKRNIDQDIDNLKIEYDQVIVVANLPYYITTPIIMKLIEESKLVSQMVLMMQLEVAKRITSKPKTKDYNSLSIAIQYKTTAQIALKVPRTVFIPAPNVDSAIVLLQVQDNLYDKPLNEQYFYDLVRASFTQRRKTLVNNLHQFTNLSKPELQNTLEELGHSSSVRAEYLSVSDFIELSDYLYQKAK